MRREKRSASNQPISTPPSSLPPPQIQYRVPLSLPMYFLLLLALTLKLSSSVCITANLFDPWADDGWYGGKLKITDVDGTVVYEITQRANVAANEPDPHEFCLICGYYQATIDGGDYDSYLSFTLLGADGAELKSGAGGSIYSLLLGCPHTCPPSSSPNVDDECSPCVAGKFSSTTDSSSCSKCARNTFSTEVGANSSTTCTPCATGLASISGSSECVEPSITIVSTSTNLATALQTVTVLDTLIVAATSTAYTHSNNFLQTKPSAISCSTTTSPPSCTFDGENTHRLFLINTGDTAQTSSLVGFTFKRGKAPEDLVNGRGGGVWVASSKADISHCLFEDNNSRYTYINSFSGSTMASGKGGGLAVSAVSKRTRCDREKRAVARCMFTSPPPLLTHVCVVALTLSPPVQLSIVRVTHTTFRSSIASNGGGIFVAKSTLTLEDCQIRDNQAVAVSLTQYTGANGGGIAIEEASTVSVKNTSIVDNSASAFGGGISLGDESVLTMADSSVTSNTAFAVGGGLQVGEDSSANVRNTEFRDNQVTMEADYEWAYISGGGAIGVVNPEFGDVTFQGCSFVDNTDATGNAADILVRSGSATVDSSCSEDYEVRLAPKSDM